MKRLLGNIYCYYNTAAVQVESACGLGSMSSFFSVGVMVIIENEPIIESNNLFSHCILKLQA